MPVISDCRTTTGGATKPSYFAWRIFRDGKLVEVNYVMNSPGGILQIYKDITSKTVRHACFSEHAENSDPDPPGERRRIRNLTGFERDLLRLTENKLRKKYSSVELHDTRIKTKVGERIIEEID